MTHWQPAAYKNYRWIVTDPDLLGGKLAIRGTRISVSLILKCLANGMSHAPARIAALSQGSLAMSPIVFRNVDYCPAAALRALYCTA
jgi:hypothetical protein